MHPLTTTLPQAAFWINLAALVLSLAVAVWARLNRTREQAAIPTAAAYLTFSLLLGMPAAAENVPAPLRAAFVCGALVLGIGLLAGLLLAGYRAGREKNPLAALPYTAGFMVFAGVFNCIVQALSGA